MEQLMQNETYRVCVEPFIASARALVAARSIENAIYIAGNAVVAIVYFMLMYLIVFTVCSILITVTNCVLYMIDTIVSAFIPVEGDPLPNRVCTAEHVICDGYTRSGKKCVRLAITGSNYCRLHK